LIVERFECYGFPFANIGELLGAGVYAHLMRLDRAPRDRGSRSDRSGIDRGVHLRLHRVLTSLPGKALLHAFMAIQDAFIHTDFGSGYVLLARRA
jgi:hypothetical protein